MLLYMLDTDIVSYALSGRYPPLRGAFIAHAEQMAISSIVYKELVFGCESGVITDKCRERLERFVQGVEIIAFDIAAADQAARLEAILKKAGTPIGQMDTLIAAHALSCEAVLVTNNQKHHGRVKGLTLENWL